MGGPKGVGASLRRFGVENKLSSLKTGVVYLRQSFFTSLCGACRSKISLRGSVLACCSQLSALRSDKVLYLASSGVRCVSSKTNFPGVDLR